MMQLTLKRLSALSGVGHVSVKRTYPTQTLV